MVLFLNFHQILNEAAWEFQNFAHAWAMQRRETAQTICKVKHANIQILVLLLRHTSSSSQDIFAKFIACTQNLIKQLSLFLKIPSSPVCLLAKKKSYRVTVRNCVTHWKIRKQLCFYFSQRRIQGLSLPVLRWLARISNSFPPHKHICLLFPAIVFCPSIVTHLFTFSSNM